jgi:hypothetical protein
LVLALGTFVIPESPVLLVSRLFEQPDKELFIPFICLNLLNSVERVSQLVMTPRSMDKAFAVIASWSCYFSSLTTWNDMMEMYVFQIMPTTEGTGL